MLTAAILAGGRASRFGGRDKSRLVVDGRTIFDRQASELSKIAGELLLVGGAPREGIRSVPDRMPGCGPLGGLDAALTAAAGEPTIVVACDMPYISAPFLAHLAALAGDADAVVPRTERGYHPLCAAYTHAALEPIARRLAAGRLAMIDLLTEVRLRVVAGDELAAFGDPHRLLANVNTPAEHDGLAAAHNHEL
jgi:molybdenum cofactor guanylyltransferase